MNKIKDNIIKLAKAIKNDTSQLEEDRQDNLERYVSRIPKYFNTVINYANSIVSRFESQWN